MLCDRSGRYACLLGIAILALPIVVLQVLDSMSIISGTRTIVFCLCCYMVIQVVAGIVSFSHLLEKYS